MEEGGMGKDNGRGIIGRKETKEAGNQVAQTGWRVVIRLCVAVSRLTSHVSRFRFQQKKRALQQLLQGS